MRAKSPLSDRRLQLSDAHAFGGYLTPRDAQGKFMILSSAAASASGRNVGDELQFEAHGVGQASEQRFRAAVEAVEGVVWTNDAEGRMVGEQPGWAALTGQSLAEYQGYGWAEAVHPDDVQPTIAAWEQAVRARATFSFEHRLRRPDGTWGSFSIRAVPVLEDDSIREWVGVHTDITEQRHREEALRDETRALETLNQVGIIVAADLDLERIVQTVTDAGVKLTSAQFGAFFYNTVDEQGESLTIYTLSGAPLEKFSRFPHPRATAVFAPTFRGEGIVRSEDILADPRYGKNPPHKGMPEGHLPVRSYLAVPVKSRSGKVLGGLFFGHEEPGVFTEREERLLGGIAGQAAIAIDNAALLRDAQREVRNRARAEDALRELNLRLEAEVADRTRERDRMWRLSTDLMLVARFDSTIVAVNPAWSVLGWAEKDLLGTPFMDLVHIDDVASTIREASRLADGEVTDRFENRYKCKDGSYRWLSWTAAPEDGLIYATARDISAEKAATEALQHTEEQLRQAQKMEAVGQLTGGIAHDFNNLLAGIVGSLDLMLTRMTQGRTDSIERYAKAALSSAQRAAALTHRLLAFSRRQPLDPKPINANQLITGMEDLLRRTIGPSHALEFVTAGGIWTTLCDPNQLESAILNLAINARDAMPEGGKLTVETCNAHLDDAYVARQRDVTPGQYVCICVTDTGTGMSREIIDRAFEPFFTTKPLGQGTGLGLSMVYGFAKQSEGHLKIYSEEGQGTTIKIYLPRHRGSAATEEGGEATEPPRAEAGETVLVVEDEPVIRDLIVEVLRDLGYRALEAADGPSGLKILQSRERIDLVVTDVGLPGLNGRQLADHARERRPDLKVLFITGYAENATLASGFLEAGMEMITKPFAVEALATKVRLMIERS